MTKYAVVKKMIIETTAVTAMALPIYAGLETFVADMSWEISLKARIGAIFLNYLFVPIGMKGREISKNLFKIDNQKSKGKLNSLHDALYVAAGSMLIKPALYISVGETDIKKIAVGTLATMAAGFAMGPIGLYLVDTFKDLTNVEPFERIPKVLKNKKPSFKKKVAAGFLAASIALTGLIYALAPKKPNQEYLNQVNEEQVINSLNKNSFDLEKIIDP
ncbi:hypothetical protein GOV03_00185 [Candidatus Woesearchaeota archaeon]|nr:hypothetical protein [Candidatus Woesearchaeota archaeon]